MAIERSSKGQAWFCTTGLPSDIVVEVDDMAFHLHKFPLMSKSRKLHLLITEHEATTTRVPTEEPELQLVVVPKQEPEEQEADENDEEHQSVVADEEEEAELCHISLPGFPGGSETFEIAAKFCYGVKVEISSSNVAPLRCAAEYLEMTEEYSEGNLVSKTEIFFAQNVLRNIKQCLRTLRSCEVISAHYSECAEITSRCIDSIAERASSADPTLFGWPMKDESGSNPNQILWNGIETGIRRKNVARSESWIDDLGEILSLPIYKQLISAMKSRKLSSEIIESITISYAKRSIPGLSRSTRKQSTLSIASESEQRELLESIITNLPSEKKKRTSRSSTTMARFLFGLLRTANILNASEGSRTSLEKKIAAQLERASLDDLLIPSYSYLIETLYDVDCVGRILAFFVEGEEDVVEVVEDGGESPGGNPVMVVGKLIDGYLSEIASDANLKPEKFCELAGALPDEARVFDDGLYRAVDVYLKAHSWILEEEREKICGVMDFQKLTLEACTHAAQNERLPLRAVVQVLFFEQLQLRHAIAGSLLVTDLGLGEGRRYDHQRGDSSSARPSSSQLQLQLIQANDFHEQDDDRALVVREQAADVEHNNTWRVAIRENQVLRLDMDSMRSRVQELEKECSNMKKVIEKIDNGGGASGWRNSLSKKLGCKFKTQVCDSHEPTVVETRRARHQRQTST